MKLFILPALIMFLTAVAVIEILQYAYKATRKSDRRKTRKRLKAFSADTYEQEAPDILRKRVMSNVPALNKILRNLPGVRNLDQLVTQANAQYPLGVFVLTAAVLGLAVFMVSSIALQRFGISHYSFSVCLAAISAGLPFFYLVLKKTKRMQKFERQLPEGLDLIARALKAGHAFSSGLQLVADQFDDPMGTEFGETIDEINYGFSVTDALKNLCGRVDCQDLKYFVVSVSLQRETGGNLAEILQSIARIIRERFKFQQKLKTLSAESRFSAVILVCLPFVIIGAISFMNPHYLRVLFTEPAGKIMLVGAGIMMMTGIIIMKKILKIQV